MSKDRTKILTHAQERLLYCIEYTIITSQVPDRQNQNLMTTDFAFLSICSVIFDGIVVLLNLFSSCFSARYLCSIASASINPNNRRISKRGAHGEKVPK